jgi:Na+-driven multidrug efflux pump
VSTATLPVSAAPRHLDRAILNLALPATGAMLLKSLFTFTDTVWCGRIDKNVLAAYGTASFYVWILNGISLVAAVGLAARVARATGAGDRAAAAAAARDGLATALPIALAATAVLWGLAPQLMALQGVGPEVAALGAAYLRTVSLGTVSFFALDAAAAALRGAGDTRTPALAALVATIVYQGLAPLLLFGWGPVPGFGIAGIGVCPVIVQSGVALFLWSRVARRGGVTMTRPTLAGMKATARIGLPSATQPVNATQLERCCHCNTFRHIVKSYHNYKAQAQIITGSKARTDCKPFREVMYGNSDAEKYSASYKFKAITIFFTYSFRYQLLNDENHPHAKHYAYKAKKNASHIKGFRK